MVNSQIVAVLLASAFPLACKGQSRTTGREGLRHGTECTSMVSTTSVPQHAAQQHGGGPRKINISHRSPPHLVPWLKCMGVWSFSTNAQVRSCQHPSAPDMIKPPLFPNRILFQFSCGFFGTSIYENFAVPGSNTGYSSGHTTRRRSDVGNMLTGLMVCFSSQRLTFRLCCSTLCLRARDGPDVADLTIHSSRREAEA